MLSVVGNVFFEYVGNSRAKGETIPTVYLNIREAKTRSLIGQMRFNKDPNYSDEDVRMAFNVLDIQLINPEKGGEMLLEEIVIGGLIWFSMDNHYLFPKGILPYMTVHDYQEDVSVLQMINAKIRSILTRYGCREVKTDTYVFDPAKCGAKVSNFLKEHSKLY